MSNRFLRRASVHDIVQKLSAKAVLEHGLIEEGDRILIAVSGGKDSTVLAWVLSALRPVLKRRYELAAVHISSDFCACCKQSVLKDRLAQWDIPFTDLFVPIIGRLKEGRSMNCYWCSTQRRSELLNFAVENQYNKIALGHHLDDILETFFMNLMAKGEFSTMPLFLAYRNYPVSLIRPLGFVEEAQIIACADAKGILKAACTCPYGLNSERRRIRARLADFTDNSSAVKRRIFNAVEQLMPKIHPPL
ncbi:MAG: tRNA 2-thiocytidine biosynthesis TtcA family protein [Spirochaetaceae bacterium]|jgi:tRNA 2-thiocytidine biosynthesis protein TtcA|nr:tRNA 2-thiocytidine biosynthesis TtcA family protein [Spirochaetaceae bacterium]